ncbi:MAG: MOSC domain-containing protein [Bacteroidota bacterium]|nr:MOSC domain-containing protein [Bacteroidota bacterium]
MTKNESKGRVVALNISKKKGIPKTNMKQVILAENFGIQGDAHAGDWHRQVSLLAIESIEKMREKGLRVRPGAFAENVTTEYLNLPQLFIGDKIIIGESILEITQIGKECHSKCAIYYQAGDCVMPREGIFARVLKGGIVKIGDEIGIVAVRKIIIAGVLK